MKVVTLSAIKREKTGKESAKKLRKQGLIPAIVYGAHEDPLPIAVKFSDFERIMVRHKGDMIIFNLEIKNGETINKQAILKDYQIHPVTDKVIHIDFQAIHKGETISVDVPIEFVGKPEGLSKGGVMEILMHEITVECIPSKIPDKLVVDISSLDLGDTLHVKDIPVPEGVKIAEDPESPVVTIVEEEAEGAAAAEEETEGGETSEE